MYGFKWESRIVDNVCNAVECIEHLIDDCPGTTGALRKKLHQVRLQMAVDIRVSDRTILADVVNYLNISCIGGIFLLFLKTIKIFGVYS